MNVLIPQRWCVNLGREREKLKLVLDESLADGEIKQVCLDHTHTQKAKSKTLDIRNQNEISILIKETNFIRKLINH